MSDIITFKGVSDGVYLETNTDNLEEIINNLNKVIRKSRSFFKGTKFLGFQNSDLDIKDKLDLAYLLKYKYDFEIAEDIFFESLEDEISSKEVLENEIINKGIVEVVEETIEEEKESLDIINEGMTKFVYGTVRSGQEISYKGNIVVIGDVNPGAHLKASGNIIVLGTLRGIAYAGLNGNKKALVAAYNLIPTQLRIADMIVRAPDGDKSRFSVPEVAKIVKNVVIIEPYLPNK